METVSFRVLFLTVILDFCIEKSEVQKYFFLLVSSLVIFTNFYHFYSKLDLKDHRTQTLCCPKIILIQRKYIQPKQEMMLYFCHRLNPASHTFFALQRNHKRKTLNNIEAPFPDLCLIPRRSTEEFGLLSLTFLTSCFHPTKETWQVVLSFFSLLPSETLYHTENVSFN